MHQRIVVSLGGLVILLAAQNPGAGAAPVPPGSTAPSLALNQDHLRARGLRVDHVDAQAGLPTFLRAVEPVALPGAVRPVEKAARDHLASLARLYRLDDQDLPDVEVKVVHQTGRGPAIARVTQRVEGREVFQREAKVLMDQEGRLLALAGNLAPSAVLRGPRGTWVRSAQEALAHAFLEVTGQPVNPGDIVPVGEAGGGYVQHEVLPAVADQLGWRLAQPARAKPVWYPGTDRLEPAWYVEIEAGERTSVTSESFALVISAVDGTPRFRHDLTAADSYSYRAWADPVSFIPHDGPQGTDATPHPTGVPDRYQPPMVPANLVTLQNTPFSRNDPWLPPHATQTTGNNADAYADLVAPDGFQAETDLRAPTTAPGVFDHTYDTSLAPNASPAQRHAAVTQLFYTVNFLHNWFYDAGFDELSGNAQAYNHGRGGLDGDALLVEAQDHAGRNNANMSTPADGARPRMQMYVWDGKPLLRVTAPAAVAGTPEVGSASFGPLQFSVTANLLIPDPSGVTTACEPFAAGALAGRIALLDRGVCTFTAKVKIAQDAGAVGVVMANNVANQPAPGLGGVDPSVTIPSLSITKETADAWKTEVRTNGTTLAVTMVRSPDLDRDAALDATVVSHEWAHYLTNRLVGNATGLTTNQARALGEGWSDFVSLLTMVRDEDRVRPGNDQFQGVYAVGGYVDGGGGTNSHYHGLRRYPYSTNMAKAPLTFKHFANGNPLPSSPAPAKDGTGTRNAQVHNGGEVWATMLWECYATLLNAYPFPEAQDRMKRYLVAALKVTPLQPTLLEARDALLAVARANDPADGMRFVTAFAKRGAGFGAQGPHRDAVDHVPVVESFVAGNNLQVVSATLDDSVAPCDADGILDVAEMGLLRVTVRNVGLGALSPFTGTAVASGATASIGFPNGNAMSFPSLAVGASATATLRVGLSGTAGTAPRAGLTVTFSEPSLPVAAQTLSVNPLVNHDARLGTSAVETGLATPTSWTSSQVYGLGAAWRVTGDDANTYFHADDLSILSDVTLTSPWLVVNPAGNTVLSFKTRYSLEGTNGAAPFYDGGVVELTTDGVTWYDLLQDLGKNPGYSNYLDVGVNPLSGRAAFVGANAAFPNWSTQTVNFGTMLAGTPVRVRFRLGTDAAAGAYGWDLDDISVTNLANLPFGSLVVESGDSCNRPPRALPRAPSPVAEGTLDAGGVLQRATVTLEGSGSLDPEGQPLSYQWTQVAGPLVTLGGADTVRATFVPDVPGDTAYAFQLVVGDGTELSQPALVHLTVLNVNQVPVAVATGPGTVAEGSAESVTLSAAGSRDPDNETLTFLWTQVAGPPVALDHPTAASATFPLPDVVLDTEFQFRLVVSDGIASSAPASVSVTVLNVDRAPMAHAGPDFTVPGRGLVALQGTATDPDGDAIAWTWTQESGPLVTLTGADTAAPSFTSPDVKTESPLAFLLTVTANGLSASDSVVVTVLPDRPPTASAGSAFTAAGRALVVLRGAGSDPDGDTLQFAWTQSDGPPVTLAYADTATPTFWSPDVKTPAALTFSLVVTANGLTAADSVQVTVEADRAPTADAGLDAVVHGRTLTLLQGTGADPDGDALTYSWTQTEGPEVTLTGADTAAPTFTSPDAKEVTSLSFELTVQANGLSATDHVVITVQADGLPIADAGQPRTVPGRTLVVLRGAGSDAEGDLLSFAWTQSAGPEVTLHDADTSTPTFTSPDVKTPADLTFTLTVTANGLAASDSVTITVLADVPPTVDAGADRVVPGRVPVTLQGAAADQEGDALAYAWEQVAGPEVVLEDDDTPFPTFMSPDVKEVTDLVFALTVTANSLSSTDHVTISVLADGAPVVDAGSSHTVPSGVAVVLRAHASDPEGDALTFWWTQTTGPTVDLEGADTAAATFVSPPVTESTTLAFQVTVLANGLQAQDAVSVTVEPPGAAIVNAGDDQSAPGRTVVVLRGELVSPVGATATFAWTQVSGTSVALAHAQTAVASFFTPDVKEPDTLVFQLTASGEGWLALDTVQVAVAADGVPVAQAGVDVQSASGETVQLHGTASDPENDPLSFAWTQTGGPAVEIVGHDTANPWFVAPDVTTDRVLTFTLVASANGQDSLPDSVQVTVRRTNHRPVARGPNALTEAERTPITLSATGSDDPDGDVLTYLWEQTGGPVVPVAGITTATLSFTTPEVSSATVMTFRLVVTDPQGAASEPLQVTLTVTDVNRVPLARARQATGEAAGQVVVLDGSASQDPDGDPLTFQWGQTAGPTVTLTNPSTAVASFTAPSSAEPVTFTFTLHVRDGRGGASTRDLTVSLRAGGMDGDDDDGGTGPGGVCACAAAGGSARSPAAALALVLLGLLARQRRRPRAPRHPA